MRIPKPRRRPSRRRQFLRDRRVIAVLASVLLESLALLMRAGRPGGNVIVRCRQAHLFTTLWIPTASLKSVRLGWWRIQRCPVGHHWSVVSPVRESRLTEEARRRAREHHDIRLP